MNKYPKEIELLVYYASNLTIPSIIELVNHQLITRQSCVILAENYGRKTDNFTIRLVVDGEEENIKEAVDELKHLLNQYAKRVSLVRLEDTEFDPPTPYEELTKSQ
ncbi:hypothetical protein CVD28_01180 [Bacillus sp. M6-12]|nr:hypothetical protein CVD28_01180 [Bacillus sp. M6-12]